VAYILASDDVRGECPDDLRVSVEPLVARCQKLCQETLAEIKLPTGEFICLLEAACLLEGDRCWGSTLDYLACGEVPSACPSCGVELYLVIGEYGIFTTAEDWVARSGKPGTIEVRPDVKRMMIEPNLGILPETAQWLCERGQAARHDEVARWIRHICGTSVCPVCEQQFQVLDAVGKF
jgi:hypothetical protein